MFKDISIHLSMLTIVQKLVKLKASSVIDYIKQPSRGQQIRPYFFSLRVPPLVLLLFAPQLPMAKIVKYYRTSIG